MAIEDPAQDHPPGEAQGQPRNAHDLLAIGAATILCLGLRIDAGQDGSDRQAWTLFFNLSAIALTFCLWRAGRDRAAAVSAPRLGQTQAANDLSARQPDQELLWLHRILD